MLTQNQKVQLWIESMRMATLAVGYKRVDNLLKNTDDIFERHLRTLEGKLKK